MPSVGESYRKYSENETPSEERSFLDRSFRDAFWSLATSEAFAENGPGLCA